MSLSISSDIVLDVARAADPARVAQAAATLNAGTPVEAGTLAGSEPSRSPSFSSVLASRSASTGARQPTLTKGPEAKAARDLETLLLQQMVETMLPKGQQSVFGQGTAGSVWRSMLAEHVARNMSVSGAIDLSHVLEKHLIEEKKGASALTNTLTATAKARET